MCLETAKKLMEFVPYRPEISTYRLLLPLKRLQHHCGGHDCSGELQLTPGKALAPSNCLRHLSAGLPHCLVVRNFLHGDGLIRGLLHLLNPPPCFVFPQSLFPGTDAGGEGLHFHRIYHGVFLTIGKSIRASRILSTALPMSCPWSSILRCNSSLSPCWLAWVAEVKNLAYIPANGVCHMLLSPLPIEAH